MVRVYVALTMMVMCTGVPKGFEGERLTKKQNKKKEHRKTQLLLISPPCAESPGPQTLGTVGGVGRRLTCQQQVLCPSSSGSVSTAASAGQ